MTEGDLEGLDATSAPDRLHVEAPAVESTFGLVHALLEHAWGVHPDVPPACRARVETAVIEILGNVVEHAFRHDPTTGRRLSLDLAVDARAVVAHLADNGQPVELDLGHVEMPDELSESGRGLAMVNAVVDHLGYQRESGRNHWTVSCLRER